MIAEIAAANAAFQIIKKAVENGSEIAKCGKAIADFTLNKDIIQKKAQDRGTNLDGSKSDLEEFLALDELKRKETELKEMMIFLGRPNMYPDYVKFCAEARKQRAEAAKVAKLKALQLQDNIMLCIYWAACIGIGAAALSIFIYILKEAAQ